MLLTDDVPPQDQSETVLVELYNCSQPTVQRPNYVCASCHAEIGPVHDYQKSSIKQMQVMIFWFS